MLKFSAETNHLLEKRLKQALQPGQIVLCALLTTLTFAVVHLSLSSGIRYNDPIMSVTLILSFIGGCALATFVAVTRYRSKRPARGWIAAAVCGWSATVAGYLIGERAWYQYMAQYYVYNKMASYVNVDPLMDKGRSYMDAGTIYFKEASYADGKKAIAFHNGLTYCVAPIMRGNGSIPGQTIDFWAVGTDCCGESGTAFQCGDMSSKARSGLRLLDDTSRAMYLLGVQEWSATTGIQVQHPVFFRWTKDPLAYREDLYSTGWSNFWFHITVCFIVAFTATFLLHSILRKARIY